MRAVIWLDDALTEALKATREHSEIDPPLGVDLWDEMERALAYATRFPHGAMRVPQIRSHDVRRFLLDRFEFKLLIAVRSMDMVVIAFPHQNQRPGYWKPRLAKVRP